MRPTRKNSLTTLLPHEPEAGIAALLSVRGWRINADLSSTGSPVWDFEPSLPRSQSRGPQGHPTGIFFHGPTEPGLCTVEPASWSTSRNPYARTFRDAAELITCLPQIEHWHAPAALTHATPAELALMRERGEITSDQLMYSLDHFPYRPRHPSPVGALSLLRDVGLLTPKEFKLIVASVPQQPLAQAHEFTEE